MSRGALLVVGAAILASCRTPSARDCYRPQQLGDVVEIRLVERLAVADILELPSCEGLDGLGLGSNEFQLVSIGSPPGGGVCRLYGARPLTATGDMMPAPAVVYPVGGPVSAAVPYCGGYWKVLTGIDARFGNTIPFGVEHVPGETPPMTFRRSIEGYECGADPPVYCADTWAAEIRLISRGDGDAGTRDGG